MQKLTNNIIEHIYITIKIDNKKKIVLIDVSEMAGLDIHNHNANIYCIDNSNNIIWQVDSDEGLMERDSFVCIEQVEDGIAARRFGGTMYIIETKMGKSKKVGWSK